MQQHLSTGVKGQKKVTANRLTRWLIVWMILFSSAFGLKESWADSQTSYDGNWYGEIECKGDDFKNIPTYTKNVSLEINGSKIIISNFGDFIHGDPFSHEGSIELKGSFFSKPGDISINGGTSQLPDRTIEWLFGGKWDQNSIFLSGERDGMECSGTLKTGKSEQVEEARLAAAEAKKQQPDEVESGSIFEKFSSGLSSGLSDIASQIGGSADPKAEETRSTTKQTNLQEAGGPTDQQAQSTNAPALGAIVSSLTGGGGSSGGGYGSLIGNIATLVTGEKAFSGRSALSV